MKETHFVQSAGLSEQQEMWPPTAVNCTCYSEGEPLTVRFDDCCIADRSLRRQADDCYTAGC